MTLSLCMIVKNEASNLARCLASVDGVVAERIVVDTGSTDGTLDVARALGIEPISLSLTPFDFAAARNVSLSHARGDWILVLDADETLEPGSGEVLRDLARQGTDVAYVLARRNVPAKGGRITTDFVCRFFPNRPELRYARSVHETLDESVLASGRKLRTCHAVLVHHLPSEEVLCEKSRRYTARLREVLAQTPDDMAAMGFLAAELHKAGETTEAMRLTERIAALCPGDPAAQTRAALYHLRLGDVVRAREGFARALVLDPTYPAALEGMAATSTC